MKRIVISGYYGFGNAGDEAVLAGLIQSLHTVIDRSELKINVLSINPRQTVLEHSVASSHRYKNFLGPLAGANLLLSGGGSLLQDVTSAHGIFYYLAIVRLAQILGKKTMFIAQGVGPLVHSRSRKLTASVANRLDAITVRDRGSSELLTTIGVQKPITITADPALLLSPAKPTHRGGARLSMRPWAGVSPGFNVGLASALSQSGFQNEIEPLNLHGAGDQQAASKVLMDMQPRRSGTVEQSNSNYRDILASVSSSELVIAMRLHALILAAASGVPSVALSYDPKVDAFMELTSQQDAIINVLSASASQIAETVTRVWCDRHARSERLSEILPGLRLLASLNADVAASLLQQ